MTVIPIERRFVCAVKTCRSDATAYVIDEQLLVYRICARHAAAFAPTMLVSALPPVVHADQYPATC